jgi:eukaryotic-like serine/threonine-protein kinase
VTEATDILAFGPHSSARTRVESLAPMGATPSVGDKIGKYVVERIIGSGGMGIVVAAKNAELDELVAIKLLRPKAAGDRIQSQRFAREARATMRIKSEHVVRILDAGETEEGSPYIVMEYLVGRDLARILQEEGPLDWKTAVDLMLQVCEAVAAAHAQGIVHRDLKPSNFFVTTRSDGAPLVKVLDFGISKALKSGDGHSTVDPKLTETQAVFGSPTYMSPEQIRSAKHVDQRSDVWSLGVALFELVTKKLPFMADNVPGLLASIVADPPFPPSSFTSDLAPGLEIVILGCLEKDPARRIPSVSELAARLQPFAAQTSEAQVIAERIQRIASAGGSAIPPPPISGRLQPTPTPRASAPAPPVAFGTTGMDLADARRPSRRSGIVIGIGIGAIVLAAVLLGSVLAYQRGKREGEAASAVAPPATTATAASVATISSTTAPVTSSSSATPQTPASSTAAHHAGTRPGWKPPPRGKQTASPPTTPTNGAPTAPTPPTDPTRDRF